MKKILAACVFVLTLNSLNAQQWKPDALSVSYYGEGITHPGIRLGTTWQLKAWEKKRGGKLVLRGLLLSPTTGFFHHKNYQNGLFFLPEVTYYRQNSKGNFRAIHIGTGYLRTFLPAVFEMKPSGEIRRTHAGYDYYMLDAGISFGKDLSIRHKIPINIQLKPHLTRTAPSAEGATWYFVLEAGILWRLTK